MCRLGCILPFRCFYIVASAHSEHSEQGIILSILSRSCGFYLNLQFSLYHLFLEILFKCNQHICLIHFAGGSLSRKRPGFAHVKTCRLRVQERNVFVSPVCRDLAIRMVSFEYTLEFIKLYDLTGFLPQLLHFFSNFLHTGTHSRSPLLRMMNTLAWISEQLETGHRR